MKNKTDVPHLIFLTSAVFTAALVFLIFGFIFMTAAPVLVKEGFNFFLGTEWSYTKHTYGIFTFIGGTLVLTAVTMAIAVPLGVFTAIFLAEWAPAWIDRPVSSMIELLVGIPSVIFGIFGFYVLEDIFQYQINPSIDAVLGFIPIFENTQPGRGVGILLAATVLAIMVLPVIVALTREALVRVPGDFREASHALGATKWETIRKVILPTAIPGVLTAVVLGLMRAMGETMAVVMLMGNSNKIPTSILDTGFAMTSKILCDIGEYVAQSEPRSALFAIGAVLFIMEFAFVALIRLISRRYNNEWS